MSLFSIKKKKKVATKAVAKPKVTAVKRKAVKKATTQKPSVSKFLSSLKEALVSTMFTKRGGLKKDVKDFLHDNAHKRT